MSQVCYDDALIAPSAPCVQAPASRIFVSQLGVLGQPVLIAFNAADTAIALETKTDEHLVRTLCTLRSAARMICCAAARSSLWVVVSP